MESINLAASEGRKDVVNYLLANYKDKISNSLLGSDRNPPSCYYAAKFGDVELFKSLGGENFLSRVNHVYGIYSGSVMWGHYEYGTLLSCSIEIQAENIDLFRFFLEKGANVQEQIKKDILSSVDPRKALAIFQLLSQSQYGLSNSDFCKPEVFLNVAGDPEAMAFLFKKGFTNVNCVDSKYGDTPLHKASKCYGPNLERGIKELIKRGAKVNARNYSRETPLHCAVFHNNLQAVLQLLDLSDENINSAARFGRTPLLIACGRKNSVEIVRALLERGARASLMKTDRDGNAPLLAAVSAGNLEVVMLLLQEEIHVTHRNKQGESALDLALKIDGYPCTEILQELLKRSEMIDLIEEPDNGGNIPLIRAKPYQQMTLVRGLATRVAQDILSY